MYKVLAIVLTLSLFQDTTAYCCFREPVMQSSCGCPDITTCGVFTCNAGSSISPDCNCGVPKSPCFRDTSDVCLVYDNPSPECSCFKGIGGGCGGARGESAGCGCGGAGGCGSNEKSFIYFPEVVYPVIALEMKPFYYGCCCDA